MDRLNYLINLAARIDGNINGKYISVDKDENERFIIKVNGGSCTNYLSFINAVNTLNSLRKGFDIGVDVGMNKIKNNILTLAKECNVDQYDMLEWFVCTLLDIDPYELYAKIKEMNNDNR